MGGGCPVPPSTHSTDAESVFSVSSGDEGVLCGKMEKGLGMNRESESLDELQRSKVYAEVFRSYEELLSRVDELDEAKSMLFSYNPGSWSWSDGIHFIKKCNVPLSTSLLLIGPTGSGKSSLVNKISRALDNHIISERAQVSYNSSSGEGTHFLHGYRVPRCSGLFCLYDTRSLSPDSSENVKTLECWMTKGVRHGELVKRESDSKDLKAQLKCKARRICSSDQFTAINFVIFVVNGLSVLESMDNADDEKKKQYCELIATNYKCPLLSFKDDKPVVVVTHGDLMSLTDRVSVRVYLGELLGVNPSRQIFDIPENNDSGTTLAIVDMLIYCFERADRNLTAKDLFVDKVYSMARMVFKKFLAIAIFFGIILAIAIFLGVLCVRTSDRTICF